MVKYERAKNFYIIKQSQGIRDSLDLIDTQEDKYPESPSAVTMIVKLLESYLYEDS